MLENFNGTSQKYIGLLKERSKTSKVYKPYQLTGLFLAELLEDQDHKSLYIKLAKNYDNTELMIAARNIAEKENIQNKGAYFMTILKDIKKFNPKNN